MELLQFEVTNAGMLGSRWTPPAPETKKASSLPGSRAGNSLAGGG